MNEFLPRQSCSYIRLAVRLLLAAFIAAQAVSAALAETDRFSARMAAFDIFVICHGAGTAQPEPAHQRDEHPACNCCAAGCAGALVMPVLAAQPRLLFFEVIAELDPRQDDGSLRGFLNDRTHQPRSPPHSA